MNKLHRNIWNACFFLILTFLSACAATGGAPLTDQPVSPNLVSQEAGDEEEYELMILDNGFQSWFVTHAKPVSYYSPSYYENRNALYVNAWNQRVNQQAYYNSAIYPFENRIEYDPSVDYGVELNYELFWYFRYIQAMYGPLYDFPGFTLR